MKELINIIADPLYSFSIVSILFFAMLYFVDIVATMKFFWITTGSILVIFIWACFDPNFWAIITWPDNIPISILLSLVFWTTWYSLYKGVRNDKRIAKGLPPLEGTPENREKVWAWPNLVYTELFTIILGTVFLVAWSILFKAPLEEPANPTWAPNPAKAPWYFLGLQEMLVYFDPWLAGVLFPGLIVVGLIAIPFLDTNPKGNGYYTFYERRFAIGAFLYGWLVLWIFLIIIGTFLRGPNWSFYGPFEYWDTHKVVAANNINVSEIFWVKFLGVRLPKNLIIREFLGITIVLSYLLGGGYFLTQGIKGFGGWLGKRYRNALGMPRYYLLLMLILFIAALPAKMYLRWLLNLKYIVFLPELELNI